MEDKRAPPEEVIRLPVVSIRPFEGHPFKVLDDELMQETVDSVLQFGILNPVIVRPDPGGGYEMVSGHRRLRACELAGVDEIPAIVRNLTDDEAVILMVDSNLQRETILPSERALAYKMKLEALKHQGKKTFLENEKTSAQVAQKLSIDAVAEDAGTTKDQVRRYIRLTELIPESRRYDRSISSPYIKKSSSSMPTS